MNNVALQPAGSFETRQLADIAGAGWLRIDPRGVILDANKLLLKKLGFQSIDELTGCTLEDGVPPETSFTSAAAQYPETWCQQEYRLRDAGDIDIVLQAVVVGRAPSHFELLVTGHNANVTWCHTEQRVRQLMDISQNGVCITSGDEFLYVNAALAEMLDYRTDELIGYPCNKVFAEEDVPFLEAHRERLLQQDDAPLEVTIQIRMVANSGSRDVRMRVALTEFGGRKAFVATILDITDQRRGEKALRDYARRLRLLSRQVLAVQEDERRNLARELHDEIGQQLTFLKLSLAQLSKRGETLERDLEEPLAGISSLMQQVRAISLDLRPSMLDDLGLTAAIRWYVGRVAKLAGLVTEIQVEADFPRLSTDVETLFFRIAQEAVTNVMRHAGAGSLHLFLGIVDDVFELRVVDDGIGFDPVVVQGKASRGKSAGLLGMQERASLAGACLELESGVGGGTCLKLTIPTSRALGHPRQS
ncbi:MAG: PAS domain-containing sensor histidine kinase [Proteobacteria bacterium]|nr:PAS domain-containing sensor histidine kinase [Pseudomonadota bacterium]